MKSRQDAVDLVHQLLNNNSREITGDVFMCRVGRNKGNCHHIGRQELRVLLDFIYESTPKTKAEEV